jgi:dipeptidyl aminopeptidase/acylaminoacyl peptidase
MRSASLLLALLLALPASADPLTPEQAVRFRRAGGLAFSPDGHGLVCAVSGFENGKGRSHLWKLDATGEMKQWTTADAVDRAPQWSADGKYVAFSSTRNGAAQIFYAASDSGEDDVRALTKSAQGVSSFRWSPDGKRLAFLAREAEPDSADDPHVYDREAELERVWVVEFPSGETHRLTDGRWRIDSIAWAGADRLLADATDRPEVDSWTNAIYSISLANGKLTRYAQPPEPFDGVTVSPGATRVAFTATRSAGPTPHDLYLQPMSGGTATDVSQSVDRPIKAVKWVGENMLYFSVTDGFFYRVYRLAQGRAPERIELPLSARDFDAAKDGTIAFYGNAFEKQAEIYLRTPDGKVRQISHIQDASWDHIALAPAETFRFKSFDGRSIEAALLEPPGATGKLPLVLLVHGGPSSSFDASSTYWFGTWPQLLVARGYQVLMVNPRGSEAYGEEFIKLNRGDWGGGDYRDQMAAVDAVLARGHTDASRLGIGGWSYGGYMSQWAPTKTSRFRAAVAGAGTFDLIAEYETEDYPQGDEWFFGTPWLHPQAFAHSSPNAHITTAHTPTLILHGEDDPANPVGQSIGFYRALKRQGVPCELVVYPREGHLPREEKHQVDMLRRMLDWYDRYLKPVN